MACFRPSSRLESIFTVFMCFSVHRSRFSVTLLGVFIVGAKRTPFGSMGGKLKDWSPTDLSVAASKAAIAQAGVDPKLIDTCVAGIINQVAAKDSAYCSRHTALKVGMLEHTPALNINRMCGSGFQSSVNVAQASQRNDSLE